MMNIKFKRLFAGWIDLFISAAIIFVVANCFPINKYVLYVIGCLFFFAKDFLGKSIGKTFLGLRIVNARGVIPPKYILLLRNILVAIWPLDSILILINNKKICDYLLNTTVVEKSQL